MFLDPSKEHERGIDCSASFKIRNISVVWNPSKLYLGSPPFMPLVVPSNKLELN